MSSNIRKYIQFLLTACYICMTQGVCGAQQLGTDTETEYLVKSAYIYKLCKFAEWPESDNSGQPFVICVLGNLPSGGEIAIPEDRKIQNRDVVVRKISNIEEIDAAEAVFICSGEESRLNSILSFLQNKPILSFGDSDGFAEKGVIFNFYIHEGTVQLEINHDSALNSLVKLHSSLFTLGRIIRSQ